MQQNDLENGLVDFDTVSFKLHRMPFLAKVLKVAR